MKYASLVLTGCALFCAMQVNAQTKKKPVARKPAATTHTRSKAPAAAGAFTPAGDGLEYRVIRHGAGKVNPKLGDVLELGIKQKIDDSLMLNSEVANMGKPIELPLQHSVVKGDLMDGLFLLKEGDSAVFRVRLDTLARRAQQPVPAWAKKNARIIWEVNLLRIKSKEEVAADAAKREAEAAERAKAQVGIDDKLIQDYLKQHNITNAKKTASGLYYVIHKEGEGPSPATGAKVTMNYTGMDLQGKKFDSNVDSAFGHVQPFEFPLGKHNVIAGWDEAVALMKKGTKATIYLPSGLAYGARGAGGQIPPNAVLIFDVELVNFKSQEEVAAEAARMQAEAAERAKAQVGIDDKLIQEYLQKNNITNAKKTASGLYYVVHKEGTGPSPATGAKVTMNYTGMDLQGKKFDSNEDPAFGHVQPFEFQLGMRNVIAGWDEAVALMKKGTRATIYLPSALAYGERGAGGQIPPNAVLIFDVELVDFK